MSNTNIFKLLWINKKYLCTLIVIIVVLYGCVREAVFFNGPIWLISLPLTGFISFFYLLNQKRKLMIYWSSIQTRSKDDAIEIIWPHLYKRTIIYERFIKWYKEDKPIFVLILLLLFVFGIIVWASINEAAAGWYYLILLGAMLLLIVPLGIDKMRTMSSVTTIRYILHMRGWNFDSNYELTRYAEKLDIDTKYFR